MFKLNISQNDQTLFLIVNGHCCSSVLLKYSHTKMSTNPFKSLFVDFQVTCGTELGVLLIGTLTTAKVPFDSSAIGKQTFCEIEITLEAHSRVEG